jgi:hypothetical protein
MRVRRPTETLTERPSNHTLAKSPKNRCVHRSRHHRGVPRDRPPSLSWKRFVGAANRAKCSARRSRFLLTRYVYTAYTYSRMKRTTIWLTDQQRSKLKLVAKRTGIQISELVRRFIDEGLKKQK